VASGDRLPAEDHAVRYCDPATLGAGGRITSAAFALREIDRGEASVVWLECCAAGGPRDAGLEAAPERLRAVRSFHAQGKLAVLLVGRVRGLVLPGGKLDVLHRPTRRNACHSGILGLGSMNAP
jgi:hypothetical protein